VCQLNLAFSCLLTSVDVTFVLGPWLQRFIAYLGTSQTLHTMLLTSRAPYIRLSFSVR
jgi:hypothetical protein